MVLVHDASDTCRLIAVRLHWIAAALLVLELGTTACSTLRPPAPQPPVQQPGPNPEPDPAPKATGYHQGHVGRFSSCTYAW